jgi:adenylate cyclase
LGAERVERRLAAILAADVAGYSRLMERDEAGTLARLRALRRELIDPKIAEHKGRIVKTTGDGLLIEFPSVVEAVACAVAMQREIEADDEAIPEYERIQFRVGINSGDVIVEDGDIHGDGVNIAARLEGIAEPGGICVSAIVHDQVQGRVDCAFADIGEQSLKNIARPVRVYRVATSPLPNPPPQAGARSARVGAAEPSLALPDKPSVAVLPFANLSGDTEQEYFADGMVEEIITALGRIRWLFVLGRNSSFSYKGQAVDVKQVGRELGVRYVLEGSVRKSGNRLRIGGRLIDAVTGAQLWADRFEGPLEDVFDLQDRIASSVAGVLEPALQAAETARSAGRPTTDLTAYDLYLRAAATHRPSYPEALRLLDEAIERDPRYAPALGLAAVLSFRMLNDGRSEDRKRDQARTADFARRALEMSGDDPGTLVDAAHSLAWLGEDIGAMLALVDRALAINPNFARGWHIGGVLRNWAGQPDSAMDYLETALHLSPRARVGTTLHQIGMAHFFARRFDQAEPKLLLAIQDDPSLPMTYRLLAACYAHTGRLEEARAMVARLRTVTSEVIPPWMTLPQNRTLRNPEHIELIVSGLRLALGETAGARPAGSP